MNDAREILERIFIGLINARDAGPDAETLVDAGPVPPEPTPAAQTPEPLQAVVAPIDNTAKSVIELARLASGAPLAAPKVDATKEFYAYYGGNAVMRAFERW